MSSDELPPKPPESSYDDEGWLAVVRVADRVSAMVLTLIQTELQEKESMNPQVAGVVLTVAMGRLAGRYGYRQLGAKAMWKACTDAAVEPLFRRGFRFERKEEN